MGGKALRTKRVGMAMFLGVVTFLSTSNTTTAETQAKNPPIKKVAKTKAPQAAKLQPQKKSAKMTLPLITEDLALATFDTFTVDWMKKLEQAEDFHKTRAQAVESPDGFAAEYVGYIPNRYITVKKTDSSDTPYVGILTYFEKKLRCAGKTKEQALQGPFDQVETSQVSEIFRFTKGKWVY
jgi:hypothetical protein